MDQQEQLRSVLEGQVRCWSGKSCEALIAELVDEQCYEVEFGGKKYQVEVQVLENTDQYLHVIVAVDDGTIPASFRPMSTSFTRQKSNR